MMEFSVLISIYKKEKPEFLQTALNSILNQSLLPSEIVLIKDGPLTPALDDIITNYARQIPFLKVFTLEKNIGLGAALNFGVTVCENELIARMDSDDIAMKDRFRKQIKFMSDNPDIVASGGHIEEFSNTPGDLGKIKKVPTTLEGIRSFARLRNPMNHPTVIFRKSAVLSVGSYKEMSLFEDYYLWLRLLKKGYRLENIDETLLYFRIGNMVTRRQGLQYFKKEIYFFKRLKKEGLINKYAFFLLIATRLPFRILPSKMLGLIYKAFLREGNFLSRRLQVL